MGKAKDNPGKKGGSRSQPTFEQAIEQLETIIEQIESGEAGLEQCLTHYEHGMKLVNRCRSILDRAQTRIAQLSADADEGLRIDGDLDDDAANEQDE